MATSGRVSLFMFSGNWVTEKETTSYAPNWRNWVYSWWKCKTQRNPARVVRFKSKVEQPLIMMLYPTTQLSHSMKHSPSAVWFVQFFFFNFYMSCWFDLFLHKAFVLLCLWNILGRGSHFHCFDFGKYKVYKKRRKYLIMKMELLDIII